MIARQPTVAVPDAGAGAVRRHARRGDDAAGRSCSRCRPAPRPSASRTTSRQFLGAGEVELFPAWETLPFERVSPSLETMGRRLRVHVAPARRRASGTPPRRGRRAGARARAAARPARRGRRADRRAARRPGRPRRARRAARRGGLPARVPGRGARRGRGARLDRRRVPVDRRPPGAHRPVGRRGRPARRRSRSPTSARRTTSPRRASSRRASCCRPPRCARARPQLVAQQPWGREQWERLAEGQMFDGMESWLPWLTDRRAPAPDLLPDDALVLLVEPRRMRDRAQELLDEEAALAATLAVTWGAAASATLPRLSLAVRPAARAHRRRRGVAAARRPTVPTRRVLAASAFDPVVGDADALAARLRALAGDGYRVVLAAEGTGSAERLRDSARRRGRRRRSAAIADARRGASASSSRRSTAASCSPARSSRSSPRPTSPVGGACTARRAARVAGSDYYEASTPGDYVVHQPARRRPLPRDGAARDGRRRARLPAGSSSRAATGLRADRPGRASCASTPAARRRRSTAWAAPTGRRQRARVRSAVREIAEELVVLYRRRLATPGPRVRARHAVAARDRGGVPVRGDARPAAGDRRRQGRHGAAGPDGPAGVRRRRLRQDRGRGARRVQGGAGRQAGRRARADDAAREPARPDVPRALRQLPGAGRGAVALPRRRRSRRRSCADVEAGAVDVVIGTHRLLSDDVQFKDLGLLVVDEEQRFGVQHKERIKAAARRTSTCSRSRRRRSRARSSCRSPASATSRS